jgi:hypothetical protein
LYFFTLTLVPWPWQCAALQLLQSHLIVGCLDFILAAEAELVVFVVTRFFSAAIAPGLSAPVEKTATANAPMVAMWALLNIAISLSSRLPILGTATPERFQTNASEPGVAMLTRTGTLRAGDLHGRAASARLAVNKPSRSSDRLV